MAKHKAKLSAQILEEATSWFIDFNEGEVDAAGREAFNAWLRRSPEHIRAYLQVSAFWEDANALSKRRSDADLEALIARARAEQNVYPLDLAPRADNAAAAEASSPVAPAQPVLGPDPGAQIQAPPPRRRGFGMALAATLLLAFGIGATIWYTAYRAPTYATEVGEQRSLTLEDGSTITLNSRTRVRVRFSEAERLIELEEGQALFKVAKDASRPFVVRSNGTRVRAVGTEFDVYRKASGMVVTVIEGRVAVTPDAPRELTERSDPEAPRSGGTEEAPSTTPRVSGRGACNEPASTSGHPEHAAKPGCVEERAGAYAREGIVPEGEVLLTAGEQLTITPLEIAVVKPTNITAATAWTEQKLVFESTPLREVVEEFNRYNRQQLVIRDPELYDFHVSGVFPSTDSTRMVEFLRQRFGITTSRSGDTIEISQRDDDARSSSEAASETSQSLMKAPTATDIARRAAATLVMESSNIFLF